MDPVKLLGWTEILLRLGGAVLIGAMLGINRELHGKPAGLRTNALVSLGAALVTLACIGISCAASGGRSIDGNVVSRAVQGIITGVGFIGAGVILHDTAGTRVRGLTTAATLWISSALGILCGAGVWSGAIVGTAFTLLVLIFGGPFEKFVHSRFPKLTEDVNDEPKPRV